MSDISPPSILRALDPSRSVVVEACAGSGKTWLLASRIVRLLLSGVAPGDILAITFTRKAAREIEERVTGWLRLLATLDDQGVKDFLGERGVVAGEATLRTARGLYERVLAARPGLAVHTFHGWFLQLVDAAPLTANLAGVRLTESGSRLFDELWQSFAAALQKNQQQEDAQAFVRLLGEAGLDPARRLIRRSFDRRSEWLALSSDASAIAGDVLAALREQLQAGEPGEALTQFFDDDRSVPYQTYLGLLELSELAGDQRCAADLRASLVEAEPGKRFALLCSVFLTASGTLRKREPGKAADKRFTPAGAARLAALHAELGERLLACREQMVNENILAFNRDACRVFAAFLAHADAYRKARRQIDFVDAEWMVLQLLRDASTAAFLQARLDARYRHVLLDEFQDTNPLQWQILLAWLDAYSDDSRPAVFLVGDPKQSIYRFRRAEPRLFTVAAEFFEARYEALRCAQDSTRRNAPPVVDTVNALFLDEPAFVPFRPQTTFATRLPGWVELIPLCLRGESVPAAEREELRDPLTEPDVEPDDDRQQKEAEILAARISGMVGRHGMAWEVHEQGMDGRSFVRPARYGDILLLVRTRRALPVYERELAAAGIPFDAGSRGGLLESLEVRDVVALLEFLIMPEDDLRLAQALRSPLFACSDDDLMCLAQREEPCWWLRLDALVCDGLPAPSLMRAARLLAAWLPAADRLPAHDLLDRIFHEGELLSRYRMAVPEAAGARVEANLRALLLLALDIDGGRYPSLPRFIDELRDLRQADAGDAPDEGVIAATDADAGRVRILTIHGAKGLEAPIVWLLGANAPVRPPDPWDVLVDWPPEAAIPRHFSFYGVKESRGTARLDLFEAEARAAEREELNLLYVAITRARQVFIASGSENAKTGDGTPYRRLEQALIKLGGGMSHGVPLPLVEVPPVMDTVTTRLIPERLPVVGERRAEKEPAERFGILLHALLERRTGGNEPDGWWRSQAYSDSEYRSVRPVAERLLAAPSLQRFFDPACYRRAWNEVEFAGETGEIHRIDRLVEFADGFWVIDYKSSRGDTQRLDAYRLQIEIYCRIVSRAFPGLPVRGGVIFADASLLEIV